MEKQGNELDQNKGKEGGNDQSVGQEEGSQQQKYEEQVEIKIRNHEGNNQIMNEQQIQRKQIDNDKQNNIDNEQMQENNQIVNDQQNGITKVEPNLSRKQIKKIRQRQQWKQLRKKRRKQQKLKKKNQKNQNKALNQQQKQQDKQIQLIPLIQNQKRRKCCYKQKMAHNQKVIIDLQFFDQMTDKQQNSLCKQLAYCHAINRRVSKPFNYIITSSTESRTKFINQKYNVLNFGISILENDIVENFEKGSMVYLTGDAQEVLTELNPNQIYIIGGIVDHNRLKNITLNYAKSQGIRTMRLPMQGIKLKASVHLAVNHVWEWMLRFYNGETWSQALKAVIPERKVLEMGNGGEGGQ